MADLEEGAFVRVTIMATGDGTRLGYAWGIRLTDGDFNFQVIYTRSNRIKEECAEDGRIDLWDTEIDSAVEATDKNTNGKIFALLAVYKLTEKATHFDHR